jgi:hypothetical protein
MDHPEQAWILTPWDSWEVNPFYHGPKVAHPEDAFEDAYEGEYEAQERSEAGQPSELDW